MAEAAARAGAPPGSIGWMKTVTLEGTQELMKARDVAVILATGGMGLVRAAYSAGKPAYGVGPGNAARQLHESGVEAGVMLLLGSAAYEGGSPEDAVRETVESVSSRPKTELETA